MGHGSAQCPAVRNPVSGGATLRDLLVLCGLFVAGVMIVDPRGDFPLNDDWSFGSTVERLLETGEYRPGGWGAMTLLTNVLWGALFCLPTGFSFDALRLSTLVMGVIGVCGTYALVRELDQSRWIAVLAALVVACNPIYFALSHTFMTDVPFTALSTLAVLCLARHLTSGSGPALVIGTSLALAATLSRQLGLFIPLAFAISLPLKRGASVRSVVIAVAPLAVCCTALLILQYWLHETGHLPAAYTQENAKLLDVFRDGRNVAGRCLRNGFHTSTYLGLFLLPISLCAARDALSWQRRRFTWLILACLLVLVIGGARTGVHTWRVMPFLSNILMRSGIGPLTLRDTLLLELHNVPELPLAFWAVVTAGAFAGGSILLACLADRAIDVVPRVLRGEELDAQEHAGLFLILCATIYLLPLNVTRMFDRYLIPALPLAVGGLLGLMPRSEPSASTRRGPVMVGALLIVTAFGCFAACTTRDYLAWNRLRWQALHRLVDEEHVSPASIDGGFEFNGLYRYDPEFPVDAARRADLKSWWWVEDDTYLLGFGPVPGYRTVREHAYRRWLPWHVQRVVVLRRE